ncbi:MAG: hypothetical protein K8R90_00590, partial [Candidatus Cloacimonetes bacterium]|nr:hypothetical protein [Candidatus Cloacimonadota bacterium]
MRRFLLLVALCLAVALSGVTLTVRQDGMGDYTEIQSAIDASADGDTVLAWPGRYFENVILNGHNITLASRELTTGDESYIHSTIIDGDYQNSCIRICDDEDDVSIRGFTLTRGSGCPFYDGNITGGGGVFIMGDGHVSLINCQVKNNYATGGGGIRVFYSDITLSGVSIHDNYADEIIGGIMFDDEIESIVFDPDNRCSIYNNWGGPPDILCNNIDECDVVLDTFTVAQPRHYFANYSWWRSEYANHNPYSFDILNGYIEPVNHDLYVAPWGDDNSDGLTPQTPLKTIALALHLIASDSENPKTVHLAEGVFNLQDGDAYYIVSLKRYVNLVGSGQETSIIDANGRHKTAIIVRSQGDSTLQDFCLQGAVSQSNASSFSCYQSQNVIFRNVTSRNNISGNYTGHHFQYGENVLYENLHILDNFTDYWYAGMEFEGKNVTFDGCLFAGNVAGDNTGGGPCSALKCEYVEGDLIVRNCVFRDNVA